MAALVFDHTPPSEALRMEAIAKGFANYLEAKVPEARNVAVSRVQRIHGGASRETYRLTVAYEAGGEAVERGMILRRDPASSLIETDRAAEYHAYVAFHGTDVPVPEPLYLEPENNPWLERPFFVMEEVPDCQAHPRMLDQAPYMHHLDKIGQQKWRFLGEISKADPKKMGLFDKTEAPPPEQCASKELDHWERVIDEDELTPQPVVRAAIRRLRRRPPPPPARLSVVHGDYRSGNFLFDEDGVIRAILDWEMWHLGDPLEDLAWALNPLWGWPDPDRPGKLIPRDDAITLWENTSGLRAQPEALWWWETFSSVKALAIWISSAKEFQKGANFDAITVFPSWVCADIHNRVLIERLMPERNAP